MAKDKFADDSSVITVNSPNVSSPDVKSPNVSSPNTDTPSGKGMVDKILDSIGLKVSDEGSA